jgi:hypothetical protein
MTDKGHLRCRFERQRWNLRRRYRHRPGPSGARFAHHPHDRPQRWVGASARVEEALAVAVIAA